MVVLYNRHGESIQIDDKVWPEILSAARGSQWQPCGTSNPPIHFDRQDGDAPSPWDGSYERPRGQTVLHTDALGLGEAIQRALANTSEPRPAQLADVGSFCEGGSFLICHEAAHGEAGTSQLVSLVEAVNHARPAVRPMSSETAHK